MYNCFHRDGQILKVPSPDDFLCLKISKRNFVEFVMISLGFYGFDNSGGSSADPSKEGSKDSNDTVELDPSLEASPGSPSSLAIDSKSSSTSLAFVSKLQKAQTLHQTHFNFWVEDPCCWFLVFLIFCARCPLFVRLDMASFQTCSSSPNLSSNSVTTCLYASSAFVVGSLATFANISFFITCARRAPLSEAWLWTSSGERFCGHHLSSILFRITEAGH